MGRTWTHPLSWNAVETLFDRVIACGMHINIHLTPGQLAALYYRCSEYPGKDFFEPEYAELRREIAEFVININPRKYPITSDVRQFIGFLKRIGILSAPTSSIKKYNFSSDIISSFLSFDRATRLQKLHELVINGIYHYGFAVDVITTYGFKEGNYDEFSQNELHEFLIEKSLEKIGLSIWDRGSVGNFIFVGTHLNFMKRRKDKYRVSKVYRKLVNIKMLEQLIIKELRKNKSIRTIEFIEKFKGDIDLFYGNKLPESDAKRYILAKLEILNREEIIKFDYGVPIDIIPAHEAVILAGEKMEVDK